MNAPWTEDEVLFLKENWGNNRKMLAGKLKRSHRAILEKAQREGFPTVYESLDGISVSKLAEIFKVDLTNVVIRKWIGEWGMPVKERSPFIKKKIKIIDLDSFWNWAEKHKYDIDFSVLEEKYFGYEPDWIRDVRRVQKRNSLYTANNGRAWTKEDDETLKRMLSSFCFTCTDLSKELGRSESAIRDRIKLLGLSARPVPPRKDNMVWCCEEEALLEKLAGEGFNTMVIASELSRSEESVKKKLRESR